MRRTIRTLLLPVLAVAVLLTGGLAFADKAIDEPIRYELKSESDIGAVALTSRVVPAVQHIRTLQDYELTPARSDMRVASAGLVFDRIDRSPPATTWI